MSRRPAKVIDSDAYNHAIAAEVRAVMARERIQQKELYETFGWDRSYLGKRMSGQVGFSIPDLTKICDYLGVDMGALIGRAKRLTREAGEREAG